MGDSKYRLLITLAAAVIVVVLAVQSQRFFAGHEPQDPPKSESVTMGPTVHDAPRDTAPDELLTSVPGTVTDNEGLFAAAVWRNRGNLPDEAYPQTYEGLRALAEAGDLEALRRLAALLSGCGRAALPMSEAEISEIVAEMQTTYSYPLLRDGKFEFLLPATGELSHKMSPEQFETFLDEWRSSVMECNAVTVEQRQEAGFWLAELEAQGGAPLSWQEAIRGMDHDARIAYVDAMWAIGDPQALFAYSQLYGSHERQLTDPSARMKAYAYIYAYYEALIEMAKQQADADRLDQLRSALGYVRKHHGAVLSEHEFRAAHELARKTVAENKNCCIRIPAG